jgi:hypothetical protein
MRLEVEQADYLGGGGHCGSFIDHAQIVLRRLQFYACYAFRASARAVAAAAGGTRGGDT